MSPPATYGDLVNSQRAESQYSSHRYGLSPPRRDGFDAQVKRLRGRRLGIGNVIETDFSNLITTHAFDFTKYGDFVWMGCPDRAGTSSDSQIRKCAAVQSSAIIGPKADRLVPTTWAM